MRALGPACFAIVTIGACASFGTSSGDGMSRPEDAGRGSAVDGGDRDGGTGAGDGAVDDFCAASKARFCTGFDRGGPTFGFTTPPAGPGFELVSGVSRPNAAQFTSAASVDTPSFFAWNDPDPAPAATIVVRFKMNVRAVPGLDTADAVLARLECANDSFASLKLSEGRALLIQNHGGDGDPSKTKVTLGQWGDVTITWNVSAGKVTATGSVVGGDTIETASDCTKPLTVSLGFKGWNKPPSGIFAVQFDDVEIDETP